MPRVVEIETAREFIDYLRPSARHWAPRNLEDSTMTNPTGWIFRGKKDAAWTLMPKALRSGAMEHYSNSHVCCDRESSLIEKQHFMAQHALMEVTAVEWFLELAEEVGIPTPIRYDLRWEISELKAALSRFSGQSGQVSLKDLTRPMPPPTLVEAFAIAQHHGIPTRLLDWTWSPLVAAYFAAKGALKAYSEENQDKRIAVWAVNVRELGIEAGRKRVKTVIASGSQNDYLRSQSGLFLYDVEVNRHFIQTGDWASLDAGIEACWNGPPDVIPFMQITAPWREAAGILRILFYERVTPAHLMPTLDNVADTFLYYKELFFPGPDGCRRGMESSG